MNSDAAQRQEKALAMLREHAASLDPDSFVSEVIRVLEGEDEAPTATRASELPNESRCPECGNDPKVFMHEKNCSRTEIPQDDLTVDQRLARLETWAKDAARWSDRIVAHLEEHHAND